MTKFTRTALMSLTLAATLGAALLATPASAQEYYGQRYFGGPGYTAPSARPVYVAPVLGDRQIAWRLERQGYRQIGPMRRDNGYVYTRAIDHRGHSVRLTVSPVNAQVVDVRYRH